MRVAAVVLGMTALALSAAPRPDRWIVVLNDPPAVKAERSSRISAASRLISAQKTLETRLAGKKGIRILGRTQLLLNAVFVSGSPEDAAAIRLMPGVQRVVPQRYYKRQDSKAAEQVRAIFAWDGVGGEQNAGAGVKIAVLDSGVDVHHPAFAPGDLQMPSGFPKCDDPYCDGYTSNKVIAARSFVKTQAVPDDPKASRPDDYSPRDRVGHGTAVASLAAGQRTDGPAGTVQGVAPKAWIGNYKIFGSPGVNDYVYDQTLIAALTAAYKDGMNIAVIAVGAPAQWSADDYGRACGLFNTYCDQQVNVVEQAIDAGMIVIVDAGNTANTALVNPAFGTINTPGTSPNAITVGAITNAHRYVSSVRAKGSDDLPVNVREISAELSNGLRPLEAATRRAVDVGKLQETTQACSELPAGSLDGATALIQRGGCDFLVKLNFAQKAGARAVVFYQVDGSDQLFPIDNIKEAAIPAVLISNTDGKALRDWIAAHADTAQIELDPKLRELDSSDTNGQVAGFSSRGPTLGRYDIKPEIAAVGTGLYVATQSYDPNGDMYSADGFTTTQGTSFAAAQVAGAAAILLQKHPDSYVSDIRSALINTANNVVVDPGHDGNARVKVVGGGKLDVENALRTNVTVDPATLSFGLPSSNGYRTGTMTFYNWGTSTVNLTFDIERRDSDSRAQVALSTKSLSLAPGRDERVNVGILASAAPLAGSYEGAVIVRGGGTTLRIPYLYLMNSVSPQLSNLVPVTGDGFVVDAGSRVNLNVLVNDPAGIGIQGAPVSITAGAGNGQIAGTTTATDLHGLGGGVVFTGNSPGYQEFTVAVGSGTNRVSYLFAGRARATPTIADGGITSAIGGGSTIAPGSLVRIQGSALAESVLSRFTPYLPLSLANVSVSFDDTANKTSYPGRLVRVRPDEIIVQAPWELQDLESVQLKVSIGYNSQSALATVGVSRFSPAFFETADGLAVATDSNGVDVTPTQGVAPGSEIRFDVSGLGPVNNRPASGDSVSGRESTTHAVPVVSIGGRRAEVSYTGLKPGSPAVYQVSVIVPSDLGSGMYPVSLSVDGISAKDSKTVVK
ncbi:MAG: S8 family serine peptidase [Acidobacteria bacterium]|nr:S8 family serine peptidase [Acidobacteriota bacterium]